MNRPHQQFMFIVLLAACLATPGCQEPASKPGVPIVKISVSFQRYNAKTPWQKRHFDVRSAYGCVITGNRILTTADVVTNATLIEVQKPTTYVSHPASLTVVDYYCNLALLEIEEEGFFNDLPPLELAPALAKDQAIESVILEKSNEISIIPGTIKQIYVDEYPMGWDQFLTADVAINLSSDALRWGPILSQNNLVGLIMGYNPAQQIARVIPAPVIRHFLTDIEDGQYDGFPQPGFYYWNLEDPLLRRYLDMTPEQTGVYVSRILPHSSGQDVLQRGDVLLAVDDITIDNRGYYMHPVFGQLSFINIFKEDHFLNESITVKLLRNGNVLEEEMLLKRQSSEQDLIPSIPSERQPDYIIVGGLIFQELTFDYLKNWGEEWLNTADKRFLYHYYYEDRFPTPERQRIVFLNKILPDVVNRGYQDLHNLILKKVNGRLVSTLSDITAALEAPLRGLHVFSFEYAGLKFALDAEQLEEAQKRIAHQYNIPQLICVTEREK